MCFTGWRGLDSSRSSLCACTSRFVREKLDITESMIFNDEGSESGRQVRKFLNRAVEALDGLGANCATASGDQGDKLHAFLAVLDRDARDSLAAVELVLAQPAISSQVIDNLNASIHLRALQNPASSGKPNTVGGNRCFRFVVVARASCSRS